jgi:hypothetical protein
MRISPRIIANLRESHFSCSALLTFGRVPTLRLIGSAWSGRRNEKCWKTRVAGFLLRFSNPCNNKKDQYFLGRKPATRVFQHFPRWRSGHAEPIRRSVGTRPRSETTRTRRQRKENAIRGDSRLFAVGFLMCPHLCYTRNRSTFHKNVSFMIGSTPRNSYWK